MAQRLRRWRKGKQDVGIGGFNAKRNQPINLARLRRMLADAGCTFKYSIPRLDSKEASISRWALNVMDKQLADQFIVVGRKR